MHIHETLEIAAERLDPDGRGVARIERHSLRVFGLLPGERGRVTVEHVSPHRPDAWGRLDERLSEVDERVVPACPGFGRCGGCTWQHLAYPAQLDEKRRRVVEALAAVPGAAARVAEVVPSPREGRYRNFGKYVIGEAVTGLTLGAYAPRSHELVPTLGCAVVEPAIDAVARALVPLLAGSGLRVYDERRRSGQLRYALVRANRDGQALVGLVTTARTPRAPLQRVAEDLRAEIGDVRGVVWVRNDAPTGALLSDDQQLLAGRATLIDRLGDLTLEVGIGTFFQINREQAARMYGTVATWLAEAGAGRVADVYCGVGGIALTIAQRGLDVTGIERNAASIAAARAAARHNGLSGRARFEAGAAETLTRVAADAVVVNPPRKGLDGASRRALVAARPASVVYVSCNPDTLARDLTTLAGAGYQLERALPFDLMPGTGQIETITFIRQAKPA